MNIMNKIMSKYNYNSNIEDLQQTLCNVISYVIFAFEKGYISERTKDEILKIINPGLMKGGEKYGKR